MSNSGKKYWSGYNWCPASLGKNNIPWSIEFTYANTISFFTDTCYFRNTDFYNHDMYMKTNIANVGDCEKLCQQDVYCYLYTYDIVGKKCWLKKPRYYFLGWMQYTKWGNGGSFTSGWQSCKYYAMLQKLSKCEFKAWLC